ncbi:MAG: excinuclease ABC subunit UvrC [Betaproteobacteria bacterium]|nr:excinuclease ABC subunit UvrC [Betaproteobacteria bacterium]
MSFDAKAFLAGLTDLPGVYRMLAGDGSVLYVGKAKNLRKRVASYFRENLPSPRIAHMVGQIAAIETTATRTEAEALLLENNLIKSLAPRYNIIFRDDKSYPYIMLTRAEFPRLAFFRGAPDRRADYYGPYPSSWAVRDGIHLLQKTFRLRTCEEAVFANRSRPCLLYQIRRCSAPCVGLIDRDSYAADVQTAALFLEGKQQEVTRRLAQAMDDASARMAFEHAAMLRDRIQSLRQVQEKQFVTSAKATDVDVIVAVAESGLLCVNLAMIRGGRHLGDRQFFPGNAAESSAPEAVAAFLRQHYAAHPPPRRILVSPAPAADADSEVTAAALSEFAGHPVSTGNARGATEKAWVAMALQNAGLALLARRQSAAQQESRLLALRDALGLDEAPQRIECFDISHTQGEAAVASCVVYEGGALKKSDYRRFNMRDITPGDDYAAIAQAVSRRYAGLAGGEGRAPDLLLIDGGKGQVAAARAALVELGLDLEPIGVAKGEGRKAGLETLVFAGNREPLQLPPVHPGLHLIQEIRDEAHRFAVSGHRARRGKARRTSHLEDIPGVGLARRKALIACFGGIAGVRDATADQLAEVPGISRQQAEAIYAALH